jgi:hypothetical protein
MRDTRARSCNTWLFPREDASWPEHYLSSAFFHDSVNQRFKQPLSAFRSLLSKYVLCIHFPENQDYYFTVLSGIQFKNLFPDNSLWGLQIHVLSTNLGPYRTRWSTENSFYLYLGGSRFEFRPEPTTWSESSVVFLSPYRKIPDSTSIRPRPLPSKFIRIHQSSATLPSEAV